MPDDQSPSPSKTKKKPTPEPQRKTNPLDPYFKAIQAKIEAANSILVLLPQNHTIDNVAAGLSLYLSFLNNYSQGDNSKTVAIASPTKTTVTYQRLYAVADVVNQLGSKNLVVTLNANYEDIEQVTTDNSAGKFNIIIENKQGLPKLDAKDFSFSYRGVDSDLVIAIDHNTPEDAGNFYLTEKELFKNRDVVSISANPNSIPLSETYLKDPTCSGNCELIAKLFRYQQNNIDPDIATNLVAGIESITRNFTTRAGAETFSVMGSLLRFGAKRFHLAKPSNTKPGALKNFYKRAQVRSQVQSQISDQAPVPTEIPPASPEPATKDQQDWTKPKIFKGGSSINKG